MRRIVQVEVCLLVLATLLCAPACHRDKKKSVKTLTVLPGETAEQVFAKAEKYLKKRDYEKAIEYFDGVRNNFPAHDLATEAHLRAAEAYYDWKQYSQAAEMYEQFRKLHPSHPRADYALLRQAEAHFRQAPKTVDRDLSECQQTASILQDFFRLYPASEHLPKAHEMSFACQSRIAGRELYIGRFYYRWGKYKASAKRLEGVLRRHSGFGYDEEAAWILARAYLKLEDHENARRVLEQLVERFPDGPYGMKARAKLKEMPQSVAVEEGKGVHEKSEKEPTQDGQTPSP